VIGGGSARGGLRRRGRHHGLVARPVRCNQGRPLSGQSGDDRRESKPSNCSQQPGNLRAPDNNHPASLAGILAAGKEPGLPISGAHICAMFGFLLCDARCALREAKAARSPPIGQAARAMLDGRVSGPPALRSGLSRPLPNSELPDIEATSPLQGLLRRDRLRVAACRQPSARSGGLAANSFQAPLPAKAISAWAASAQHQAAVLAQILLANCAGHKRLFEAQQPSFRSRKARRSRAPGPGPPVLQPLWAGLQPFSHCSVTVR